MKNNIKNVMGLLEKQKTTFKVNTCQQLIAKSLKMSQDFKSAIIVSRRCKMLFRMFLYLLNKS